MQNPKPQESPALRRAKLLCNYEENQAGYAILLKSESAFIKWLQTRTPEHSLYQIMNDALAHTRHQMDAIVLKNMAIIDALNIKYVS